MFRRSKVNLALLLPLAIVALLLSRGEVSAQVQSFDSESDGRHGKLDLTSFAPAEGEDPVTLDFYEAWEQIRDQNADDPQRPSDHIYHFTEIIIPAGVTLRISGKNIHAPVYWLATGTVQINGGVDLSGKDGHLSCNRIEDRSCWLVRSLSEPGAGGFAGGFGGNLLAPPGAGLGPFGGGVVAVPKGSPGRELDGNGGGLARNRFAVPLLGGSGGGGGHSTSLALFGNGGGAGGGAIMIASSQSIDVNGFINVNGGRPLCQTPCNTDVLGVGGQGSAGMIRLAAPKISGTGGLFARPGGGEFFQSSRGGAFGIVRLEAFQDTFVGQVPVDPFNSRQVLFRATPFDVHLPSDNEAEPPSVRVVRIDEFDVTQPPTGDFNIPDVTINSDSPVTIEIEAENVTPGATVTVKISSEDGDFQTVESMPLEGSLAFSTATAQATLPRGFTQFHLEVISDTIALAWEEEEGVRLDVGPAGSPDSESISFSNVVLLADGNLRMYYVGFDGSKRVILSAFSEDGINWTKEAGIRLEPGGPIDSVIVIRPKVVLLEDGGYRLYYMGGGSPTFWRILSAKSDDGLNWIREDGIRIPLPHTTKHTMWPEVIRLPDGRLRMYYGWSDLDAAHSKTIRSAVSSDGLNWDLEPGNHLPLAQNNCGGPFYEIPIIQHFPQRMRMTYIEVLHPDCGPTVTRTQRTASSFNGFNWRVDPLWPWVVIEDSFIGSIIEMPDGTVRAYHGKGGQVLSAVQVPLLGNTP